MLEINSTSLWSSITNLVFSMYTCFLPLIKINHPWVLISIFVVVKSRELEPSLKFHIAKKKIPYINNAGERYWLCLIIIITSINNNVELLQMRFSLHGLAKLEKGSPVESSLFYTWMIVSTVWHSMVLLIFAHFNAQKLLWQSRIK